MRNEKLPSKTWPSGTLTLPTGSPTRSSAAPRRRRTPFMMRSSLHGRNGARCATLPSFEAWFSRIVVNTCRNRLKQTSRRASKDIAQTEALATPDAAQGISDRAHVEQALSRLKPDDQILMALRYDQDLKLADIARLLGVPTGTVKWRLSTAHKYLRSFMERAEGNQR